MATCCPRKNPCRAGAPCDYCYEPPEPIRACGICEPCEQDAITCDEVVPVIVHIANTACTAILSVRNTLTLNASEGSLEVATVAFTGCTPPCTFTAPNTTVNGSPLFVWVDLNTPNLWRLGTSVPTSSVGSSSQVVALPWSCLGLSGCDDLPLTLVLSPDETTILTVQQFSIVTTGDASKNLFAGDLVIMYDVKQGWGDIGVAQIMAASFRKLDS